MNPADRSRVIVGLDGSLASLRALRRAVWEARQCDAELHVVHVRRPTRPDQYVAASRAGSPPPDEWLDRQAEGLIAGWLGEALGGAPIAVPLERRVMVGSPGRALVQLSWRDGDLLVVGTRRRRRLRRLLRGSVSRYVIAHTECPVLVVPPDSFARAMRGRSRFRGSLLHRDLWKRFDAAAAAGRHPSNGTSRGR